MEEARPHCAIGFHHGGDPGSNAARRDGLLHTQVRAKMIDDAAKLAGTFEDELIRRQCNQRFHFLSQRGDLIRVQADFLLTLERPSPRTVKRARHEICR